MPTFSDYEYKVDQYHNNYVNIQNIARELAKSNEAENQKMIAFYEGMAAKVKQQEAEFFQVGVQAAGNNVKNFLADVLNHYPDIENSQHFQERLQEHGLKIADLDLDAAHKMPKINLKFSAAYAATASTAIAADYKEASKIIHQPGFEYLTEAQKNEYPHVYASAKFLRNVSSCLDHEQAYASFREWAVRVDLKEQDWVKLDPTPVTRHNITQGFPASGLPNPLEELGRPN